MENNNTQPNNKFQIPLKDRKFGALWVKKEDNRTKLSGKLTLNGQSLNFFLFEVKPRDGEQANPNSPKYEFFLTEESYLKLQTQTNVKQNSNLKPVTAAKQTSVEQEVAKDESLF